MIQGDKPSGYFVTQDLVTGKKIEGETRMCAHCQYKWQYRAGSGTRRGFCTKCNGLLCGRPLCMQYCIPYIDKIEGIEKGFTLKQLIQSVYRKYGSDVLGKTRQV